MPNPGSRQKPVRSLQEIAQLVGAGMDPVVSVQEAAAYACCNAKRIRLAVHQRELGCIREGQRGHMHFRISQLDRWLKSREVPPSRLSR